MTHTAYPCRACEYAKDVEAALASITAHARALACGGEGCQHVFDAIEHYWQEDGGQG